MRTLLLTMLFVPLWASAAEPCKLSDGEVRIVRWFDKGNSKIYFAVVGELINNCNQAAGIEVRFVGRDAKGELVTVNATWPNSIKNVPAHGRVPFETTAFHYDPRIKTLTAEVSQVKQWR